MASYTDRVWVDGRENGTAARWNAAAANDWEARIKAAFAAIVTGGTGTGGVTEIDNRGTISANATLDMSSHQDVLWQVTLGANNLKLEIVGWSPGKSVTAIIKQDATGGRTLAALPTAKWEGGTIPTGSSTSNAIDIRAFFRGLTETYGFESGTGMA